MKNNTAELLRLVEENPDLPVIPLVEEEVVADYDFTFWMGSWGECHVGEYLRLKDPDRAIVFKDDEDIVDTLEYYFSDEDFEKLPATEEECRSYYDALPWEKAILVYITLPEE